MSFAAAVLRTRSHQALASLRPRLPSPLAAGSLASKSKNSSSSSSTSTILAKTTKTRSSAVTAASIGGSGAAHIGGGTNLNETQIHHINNGNHQKQHAQSFWSQQSVQSFWSKPIAEEETSNTISKDAATTTAPTTNASTTSSSAVSSFSTTTSSSTTTGDSKKKLTTTELVKVIAETHELSQAESKRILDTVFHTITESLSKKEVVSISNFGTFETYERKSYTGRNPSTGQPMTIPSSHRVKFKPYKSLKDTVAK